MSIGHPDFQRQILVSDNPFVAADKGLTSGVEEFPFLGEQALKYASYQLRFAFNNGAASPTNYAGVTLRFYSSLTLTRLIWEDFLEINPGGVSTYVTDRIHGAQMSLVPIFPGGTLDVVWMYSNRPADRLHILEAPKDNDRIMISHDTVNVGAGATSGHRFVPLWNGPVIVSLDASAGINATWSFYFGSNANIHHKIQFPSAPLFQELILPTRPMHYTVTNTGAAAADFITSIWGRDN